ncbi:hypothetical protein F5890DRAFT_1558645 [Lentinula detonsa]|uniref:Uncharacterized protein n=1 Tax=Lentinula detonsa TaxID=2804962 RepID=A0AA38PQL0_9AGAR|nr:hypothetical protein F5890DRAFT_1558645 [Lentinula detonsa]
MSQDAQGSPSTQTMDRDQLASSGFSGQRSDNSADTGGPVTSMNFSRRSAPSPRHSPYHLTTTRQFSHSPTRKRVTSNTRERSNALPDIMQGIPLSIQRYLAESTAQTIRRAQNICEYEQEIQNHHHPQPWPVISQQDPNPLENASLPPASGPQRILRRQNRLRRMQSQEILVPFRIPMISSGEVVDICRITCTNPGSSDEAVFICGQRYDTAERLIQHLQIDHFSSGGEQVAPSVDASQPCLWQGCSGVSTVQEEDLINHIIRDHTPFRIRCTRCGVVFNKRARAVLHLWQSRNGRRAVPGEESWCEYWQRGSSGS